MDAGSLLAQAFWAGVLSAALAVIFTVPRSAIPIAAMAGFAGRLLRDFLTGAGVDLVAAAFVASVAVTVIAILLAPRHHLKPIVAMSALVPIGASVAAFGLVKDGLRIANEPAGQYGSGAATALASNLTTLISVTFAIALGFMIPWSLAMLHPRRRR
ncbi:MAG: threonine/serine exporter family protein [Thermomicrobiales bacterium]